MPWPKDAQFYNFNEFSILLNAKPQYGVYAVFSPRREALLVDCGEVLIDLIRLTEGARTDREFWKAEPSLFSYVLAPFEEAQRLKKLYRAELLSCRTMPKAKAVAAGA